MGQRDKILSCPIGPDVDAVEWMSGILLSDAESDHDFSRAALQATSRVVIRLATMESNDSDARALARTVEAMIRERGTDDAGGTVPEIAIALTRRNFRVRADDGAWVTCETMS